MIPSRERIERPKVRSSQSNQKLSPQQPSTKDATSGYSLKSNKGYLVPSKPKVQRPISTTKKSSTSSKVGNQGIRVTPIGTASKSATTTNKTNANDGIRITPCGSATTTRTTKTTSPPDTSYHLKGKNGRLVPTPAPAKKKTTHSSWSYYDQ